MKESRTNKNKNTGFYIEVIFIIIHIFIIYFSLFYQFIIYFIIKTKIEHFNIFKNIYFIIILKKLEY